MEFRYKGQTLGGMTALPTGIAIYSEEETVIGICNGKPVYRRFLKGLQAPSAINTRSEYPSYGKSALNVESVVSLRAVATNSNGATETLPVLGYRGSDDAFNCFILDWQDEKLIISNINRGEASSIWLSSSVDVLLEYTKTTDAEGSVTPLPLNYVQDYDTEDGWHVRKYSDGYVEMTLIKTCDVDLTSWGSDTKASVLFSEIALPLSLTRKLSETAGLIDGNTPCGWLMQLPTSTLNVLTTLNGYQITRPGDNTGSVTVSVVVTGRWK